MMQFQRSGRREPMPDAFEKDGTRYNLIFTAGNPGAEKRISEWKYQNPGTRTIIKDPDGRGFFYLYAEVPA